MKNKMALLALSMGTALLADNCSDPYCESCCEEPCAPDFYYEEPFAPNFFYEPPYGEPFPPNFSCEEPGAPNFFYEPPYGEPYPPNFYCEEPGSPPYPETYEPICEGPCECPQPRAICKCSTPSFYDPAWDQGLFLTFDLLYWCGRESNLNYAARAKVVPRTPVLPASSSLVAAPTSFKHLDVRWRPGVRIGIGWNTCDGWDFYTHWTYYKAKGKSSASGDPFVGGIPTNSEAVIPIWTDLAFHDVGLQTKASAKWRSIFNAIDLELGRRYYLSECFTLRPYTGLRWALTETKFAAKGKQEMTLLTPTVSSNLFRSRDSFHNNNWGIGILAGFQPVFYFCESLSLYANADVALLRGRFHSHIRREYCNTSNGTTLPCADVPHSNSKFFGMQPALDLAMGLCWETDWCDHSYSLEFSAGWEHHIWFDYNSRMKLFAPVTLQGTVPTLYQDTAFEEVNSNLEMGGFLLKLRFSF